MTTETTIVDSSTITKWISKNGYIAYPKDLVIKGILPDDFPIEIFLENGVRIAFLYFDKEGGCVLEGWMDSEHSIELAEKISSAFNIKVVLL